MIQYLEVFDDYYKRDRHLADKYANFTYSFPAFIELVRAAECDTESQGFSKIINNLLT